MRKPESCIVKNKGNAPKLKKGLWSPEEDEKLTKYMLTNGQGCWSDIARNAGLRRCGKSCRLRWINYLRPDLKRGAISPQEEELIIRLHSLLGNRWSQIAARLPGRTDNEIKNFWNSTIKKRLKNISLSSTRSPNTTDSLPEQIVDHGVGAAGGLVMTMQEHNMVMGMFMDTSSSSANILSSSSSTMQSLAHISTMIDPLPSLDENHHDQVLYFNAQPCIAQDQNINAVFGGATNISMQVQLSNIPILESPNNYQETSSKIENSVQIRTNYNNINIFDDIINQYCNNNNTNCQKKVENVGGIGFGQEELIRLGEWDLEELMKDIPSFPFLDFPVE